MPCLVERRDCQPVARFQDGRLTGLPFHVAPIGGVSPPNEGAVFPAPICPQVPQGVAEAVDYGTPIDLAVQPIRPTKAPEVGIGRVD